MRRLFIMRRAERNICDAVTYIFKVRQHKDSHTLQLAAKGRTRTKSICCHSLHVYIGAVDFFEIISCTLRTRFYCDLLLCYNLYYINILGELLWIN